MVEALDLSFDRLLMMMMMMMKVSPLPSSFVFSQVCCCIFSVQLRIEVYFSVVLARKYSTLSIAYNGDITGEIAIPAYCYKSGKMLDNSAK